MVGVIENHQAREMTREEAKEHIAEFEHLKLEQASYSALKKDYRELELKVEYLRLAGKPQFTEDPVIQLSSLSEESADIARKNDCRASHFMDPVTVQNIVNAFEGWFIGLKREAQLSVIDSLNKIKK